MNPLAKLAGVGLATMALLHFAPLIAPYQTILTLVFIVVFLLSL